MCTTASSYSTYCDKPEQKHQFQFNYQNSDNPDVSELNEQLERVPLKVELLERLRSDST